MRINQAIHLCVWSHGGKHSRLGSGSKWSVDTKQIRRYGRVPSQESFILNKHRGHFWGQITVCSPLSETNKSENLQNLCKSVGTINLIDTTISGSTWMQPSLPLLGQLAIHPFTCSRCRPKCLASYHSHPCMPRSWGKDTSHCHS